MFQTEPIIYLQSLGTPLFTFLMIAITTIGNPVIITPLILIVIFGIDFKKGFLLLQLLLWTGLVSDILKILVAFPRPDFVDNRVHNLEFGIKNTSPLSGNEPKGIFSLPDKQILKAFSLQKAFIPSPAGFPSGHVALTTSLWGGSAIIFKNSIIKLLTPIMIVAVAFSRVYLGRHFIGDVLGGVILGLIFLVIFSHILKSSLKEDFFKKESFELAFRRQNLFYYCFMFLIPFIFTALSIVDANVSGLFLGTNVAYLLIISKGIPEDTGNVAQRATRVFIAFLLFGITFIILYIWFKTAGTPNYLHFTIEFMQTFIPAITIWVSVAICKKFDLYRRDTEGSGAKRKFEIDTME
jgi:membrane-associated phospholipid phosphatase